MSKERKLDKLFVEFDKEYNGKSQEEMEKIISDLEKEVAGKENSLKGLEGEKQEKLQKDIEQGKKRLENLKGYSKNKKQIEEIRRYKDSLIKKLEQQKTIKDESFELVKKADEELKKVSKKLNDEKYTMTLTNQEYNDLLEEKSKLEKEMRERSAIYLKAKDRVVDLQTKISKCNLAWKTLFVNKDWDEIHRRALSDNTRFTRKIDFENNIPLSARKREKQEFIDKDEIDVQKQVSINVEQIMEQMKNEKETKDETKALVEKKDGFFRRIWNKIVNWVKGEEESKKDIVNTGKSKSNSDKQKTDRDMFLEGLRQHIDVEYRKSVKQEKEEKARVEYDDNKKAWQEKNKKSTNEREEKE